MVLIEEKSFLRIVSNGSIINGQKKIFLPFLEQRSVAPCLYNALDKNDQAIVKAVIDQIEEIIAQGTEGQPDADYWKKIAKIIKDNGIR